MGPHHLPCLSELLLARCKIPMLHWCGTGSGGSALAAPCSISILFPISNKQAGEEAADGSGSAADGSCSAASSSVDCTLSLRTPYTRQHPSSSSLAMQWSSALCWDKVTQPGKHPPGTNATGSSSVAAAAGMNLGGDPLLLASRCTNCETTSTPLWRNGPRGPKCYSLQTWITGECLLLDDQYAAMDAILHRKESFSYQLYSNTPADFDFKLESLAQGFHSLTEFAEHLAISVDIVFPAIHGRFGEDGGIQELLEKANVPFIGTPSAECHQAFDKICAVLYPGDSTEMERFYD